MSQSRVSIDFTTENAAFEGEGYFFEAARILRVLADKIESQELSVDDGCIIRDINGNKVGYFNHTHGE